MVLETDVVALFSCYHEIGDDDTENLVWFGTASPG